jgi:phosphoadenosine phosphosulfate reductase family protein
MDHIVALSGGKDSTAMALMLAEIEPREYDYICTPTGNELPEMVQHWINIGIKLGKPLKPITSGRSLAGLIQLQNALPNWRMRWCTRMLKIEPFERYVMAHLPCTVYVGIRADEQEREGVDYAAMSDGLIVRRFPLVEWGWGIGDVVGYLAKRDVVIPDRTDCADCFFQTLYEWWTLWKLHPDLYAEGEYWEKITGHTLRSEQRDTWPTSLNGLRLRFESGDIPKQRTKMKDRKVMCSVCAR